MTSQSSSRWLGLFALLLISLTAAVVYFVVMDGGGNGGSAPESSLTLKQAIAAVAASEDAQYEEALLAWRELSQADPDNEAFKLNEAVTVLKWISESSDSLSSGQIADPSERAVFEAELEKALGEAEEIIGSLDTTGTAARKAMLLKAAFMAAKIKRLPYPADEALRLQAAQSLAEFLKSNPAEPQLAALYADLVDELAMSGAVESDDALAAVNVDALYASWKSAPRNLALLRLAADALLDAKDPRLAELLTPSVELTRHFWTDIAREVERLDPETLVTNAKAAIEAGDWQAVVRTKLPLWLNTLQGKGSLNTAFRADGRLVRPDIMALLDTSFLTELASKDETIVASSLPTEWAVNTIPSRGFPMWLDYNLDLRSEIAFVSGKTLSIYDSAALSAGDSPIAELELDQDHIGGLVAEFFEIDAPERPRKPLSVAEVATATTSNTSNSEGQNANENAAALESSNRHDTCQDILLWGPNGVQFVTVTPSESTDEAASAVNLQVLDAETGLEDALDVVAAIALDIESDGDLDLMLATRTGVQLYRNNGNRTFDDLSEASQFSGDYLPTSFATCDYDNDLDQDVLAIAPECKNVILYENLRHGQFRETVINDAAWPQLVRPSHLQVAELDGNSSWDLVVADQDRVQLLFSRTPAIGTTVPLRSLEISAASEKALATDINNDGFLDIVAASDSGLSISTGAPAGWSPPVAVSEAGSDVPNCIAGDSNEDGLIELVVSPKAGQGNGEAKQLAQATTKGGFLQVRIRGRNDDNGGGRVNHFGIGTTLEVWVDGRQQRHTVDRPLTHFGIGDGQPENLRVVFPNGLTQNVPAPKANTLVEERQELKGSCPFLYTWNGEEFAFVTDLLWNAPLGLQVAPGKLMPDRRWEYLAIPGENLAVKDGYYELRITEELWEVAYFDHVQLIALDHSEQTTLLTNEKVGPPDIAAPTLFLSENRIHPVGAVTSEGRNVLASVAVQDRDYAQCFEQFICQGYTQPHFLELDFGKQARAALDAGQSLRLVLTGWMHPTDTSLNIGLSQNDRIVGPEPPSLWVLDENEQWKCAIPMMGFPGGKPKTIVVDLDGVFKSDDTRIRIAGSQQIYWDEAYLTSDVAAHPLRPYETNATDCDIHTLNLDMANLRYRGFSKLLPRSQDQPHWYDYDDVSRSPKWPELNGPFTRFGDVTELLTVDDDKLVVMTAGDEIILRFSAPPPPSNGIRRDFVLHCTGWDKDAD
ncbi:MAG: VCBS repeat-containing protein, partial [Planctomycetota bacterium]